MSRIKSKFTNNSSISTFNTNSNLTTIDKYVRKNNRFALNELCNNIKLNNNENIEFLFKSYINKTKLVDDLLNLSCVMGDEILLDKLFNFIQQTSLRQQEQQETSSLSKYLLSYKIAPITIYYAIKGKTIEILKKLALYSNQILKQNLHELKLGEYLNEDYDETTLIRAIKNQLFEQVYLLIENYGASLDLSDSKKRTPLHFAASFDNFDIMDYLINKGVNLNSQCIYSDTPLINACLHRKYKNIELLLDRGANIDLKGNYGNSPMHILVTEHNCKTTSITTDIDADIEIIKKFLASNVDLCSLNDKQQTCFTRACGTQNLNLCKLLLNELIKRYSKLQQPHSLYYNPNNLKKKLLIKTNLEFLNQEIINGLLNATCYLRINIIKFLFKFIHNKYLLSNELFDLFENKILVTILQRKDINEFNNLFKLFMSYDCYPPTSVSYQITSSSSLFYINMLIRYWNVKLHIPSTYTFEPLELCIQEQINLLIYYNKYNYQQLEQIYFDLFPGVQEDLIINSLCTNFRKRYAHLYTKPKSLKLTAKNVIRKSIVSLSEKNLNSLNLPKALQDYLVDFN